MEHIYNLSNTVCGMISSWMLMDFPLGFGIGWGAFVCCVVLFFWKLRKTGNQYRDYGRARLDYDRYDFVGGYIKKIEQTKKGYVITSQFYIGSGDDERTVTVTTMLQKVDCWFKQGDVVHGIYDKQEDSVCFNGNRTVGRKGKLYYLIGSIGLFVVVPLILLFGAAIIMSFSAASNLSR